MNSEAIIERTIKHTKKRNALMLSKRHDYANVDVLANFKQLNQLCKTLSIDVQRSPADCARFLLLLKIARWCNLINKGVEPMNETMEDTILDLLNYVELADACDIEEV